MLFQQTIEKLYDLRLKAMAAALTEQVKAGNCCELSFDERFGLLVDHEWQQRQDKRLQRRLKEAKLKAVPALKTLITATPEASTRKSLGTSSPADGLELIATC